MKRIMVLALAVLLFHGGSAFGQDDRGGRGGEGGGKSSGNWKAKGGGKKKGKPSNRSSRQPRANGAKNYGGRSYGNNNQNNRSYSNSNRGTNYGRQNGGNPSPRRITSTSQLRSMGVHSYPRPFANRSQLMVTDRAHSTINYPTTGPGGMAYRGAAYNRAVMSGPAIRAHMNLVMGAGFNRNVVNFNLSENIAGRYYWHSYSGFNYCHYYWGGYHWYGWYLGSNYFWTRYWGNHFWWYDPVYFRWCYWWDGGWWWQDPYHVNAVYVYNNGTYVSTSTGANVDVAAANPPVAEGARVFTSPDGARMVKITGSAQDAFLYDTSASPAFQPIYLASGVKDVKMTNTSNGRPLQVMLVLNDGSFDLFDEQGNPYNGNGGGGNVNSADNMPSGNAPDYSGNSSPIGSGGNPPPADNGNNPPPAGNGMNPPADNGGNPPPAGGPPSGT